MKILLEVKDSKAAFILELLNSFSYVRTKTISPQKSKLPGEIKEAFQNLHEVEKGSLKAQSFSDLLDEL